MIEACRKALMDRRGTAEHAGMVLAYLLRHQKDGPTGGIADDRGSLFKAAIRAAKASQGIYALALRRWQAEVRLLGSSAKTVEIRGRLIVGLGDKGVLETGITIHRTYGLPYIPGSALKGLASHYALQEAALDKERHKLLFGETDDSGYVVFHDAWISDSSVPACLAADVMTPHHSKYYSESAAPLDSDTPIPVPFLSVTGEFHVAVTSPDWPDGAAIGMNLLLAALRDWGVGGKTSSGYGRMYAI